MQHPLRVLTLDVVGKTKCWACVLNASGLGGCTGIQEVKVLLEYIPGFLVSGRLSSHVCYVKMWCFDLLPNNPNLWK